MKKRTLLPRVALYGGGVLVALTAVQLNQQAYGGLGGLVSSLMGGSYCSASAGSSCSVKKTVGFQQVKRQGSVDVAKTYDITNLSIPASEIHTLLPCDAIPSLTDPKRETLSQADWLREDDRVVVVAIKDEAVAVPLRVLDWHEVVNMTVGGEPIAATYCPLCDSASVFSRRLLAREGQPERVLEFGVSGALYNSNVLMYDRTDKALWSQLGMRAVSGSNVGTKLRHLPIEVVPAKDFRERYPDGQVVSLETGYHRDYSRSPYLAYFAHDDLMVPVKGVGNETKAKKLGVGLLAGDEAWFVTQDALADDEMTIVTPLGEVRLAAVNHGLHVVSAPEGVYSAQTFYFSWSAFYPQTQLISKKSPSEAIIEVQKQE